MARRRPELFSIRNFLWTELSELLGLLIHRSTQILILMYKTILLEILAQALIPSRLLLMRLARSQRAMSLTMNTLRQSMSCPPENQTLLPISQVAGQTR